MLLSKLLSGLDVRFFGIDEDMEITRPFSDSRRACRGGLFICLRGTRTDGNKYAAEAMARGALAVVSERVTAGIPTVKVRDVRYALSVIWNNFYKRPALEMRFFGITGTNGKTSTAAFLSSCLAADGRRVGTIGTLGAAALGKTISRGDSETGDEGAAMTTPDPEYLFETLDRFRSLGVTDVVMEVSSHGILLKKADAIPFQTGVFTNLSPEHLDCHKSLEEYFRVKASFVARCEKRVVNRDCPYCRRFSERIPSLCVGMEDISDLKIGRGGISYILPSPRGEIKIESAIGGAFTAYNTLLAASAALLSGVGPSAVKEGISALYCIPGRLERAVRAEECGFDVFIDYAHTPDALEGVLRYLRNHCHKRLICLFGCGGDRDREKRPLMGRIAQRYSDRVFVTGDNPRTEDPERIIEDITSGMEKGGYTVIPDRKEAIITALSRMESGDTLLLAGKGHETYEIGPSGKRYFDERRILTDWLEGKYGK